MEWAEAAKNRMEKLFRFPDVAIGNEKKVTQSVFVCMRYDPKVVLAWFKQHGLTPVAEHRFHPERKWRFDFCFPESKLALEVEGGIWKAGGGRHNRPAGFLKDIEKYNTAAMLGWRILRTTPSELCMQETVDTIKIALRGTI